MRKSILKFLPIVLLAIITTTLFDKKLLELFYSEYGILFNLTSSLVLSITKQDLILPNWGIFNDSGQLSKEFAKLLLTLNLAVITVWIVDGIRNVELFYIKSSDLIESFIQSIFNILISIWIVVLSEIIIVFVENNIIPKTNLTYEMFYEVSIVGLILLKLILEMIRERVSVFIGYKSIQKISESSNVPVWFVILVLPLIRTFLSIIFGTLGMVVKLGIVIFIYNLVQSFDVIYVVYIFILYLLTLLFDKLQQSLYASLI